MLNGPISGVRIAALVGVALGFAGCSPRTFDAVSEQAKLLRLDAEWADLAASGKDVDRIVSYWSDDAILMFPGQPVLKGKLALRAYVAGKPENSLARCRLETGSIDYCL
jgi:hypothetical protein